jgi:hypothetical protein
MQLSSFNEKRTCDRANQESNQTKDVVLVSDDEVENSRRVHEVWSEYQPSSGISILAPNRRSIHPFAPGDALRVHFWATRRPGRHWDEAHWRRARPAVVRLFEQIGDCGEPEGIRRQTERKPGVVEPQRPANRVTRKGYRAGNPSLHFIQCPCSTPRRQTSLPNSLLSVMKSYAEFWIMPSGVGERQRSARFIVVCSA